MSETLAAPTGRAQRAQTIADCILSPWGGLDSRPTIVIDPDPIGFDRLRQETLAWACDLIDLGVQPGDRVGILMPNSLGWIECFLAVGLVGAVSVPLNTRYEMDELRYVADHAGLHTLITTDQPAGQTDFADLVRRSLPEAWDEEPPEGYDLVPIRHVIVGDLGRSWPQPSRSSPRRVSGSEEDLLTIVHGRAAAVRPGDVAAVLYTSGTTSQPKGCLMRHEALVRTGTARFEERRRQPGHLTVWTPCPLFHVGALVPLLGCLATGSTYVTSTYFDADQALTALAREQVTTALPLFSAFTDAMLDSPRFADTDLSHLQDILTTGPRSGVERAQRAFAPAKIVAGYGMTELCGVAASSPVDESDEERLIWTGRPFDGIEMTVVDAASGRAVPPGTIGEIVARGYCAVSGYLNDAAATSAAFDQDGWFHTGDMGVASADGRLAFRGRFKDMLKVGGENVSALEVEEYLGRHPAVRRVEVVGVPDPRLDEVVAAFVELEPGGSATADELIASCRGRIARFKVPRHLWFVRPEDWPMSATKVDKVTLRQWAVERR